jgi:hypothetical protein
VTEVDRFFRQLVSALAAAVPDRLREPVTVGDISGRLLPYRSFRRALQIDTSEDYELALLRLCAGEGGYAHTEPPEALALFQAEVASRNPDLGVLDRARAAALILAPRRVAEVLSAPADLHQEYAPPPPAPATVSNAPIERVEIVDADDALPLDDDRVPPPAPAEPELGSEEDEATESTGARCSFCGGALPTGRVVNFCPHCGQSQSVTQCPECRSDVEIGWRHCITCGFALGA